MNSLLKWVFFQFGELYEMEILVDIEYDEVKFRNVTEFSTEQQIWRFSEGFSLEIAKKIATTDHSLVHSFFKMDTTYDRTKFAISSFLRLTQHHSVLFALKSIKMLKTLKKFVIENCFKMRFFRKCDFSENVI